MSSTEDIPEGSNTPSENPLDSQNDNSSLVCPKTITLGSIGVNSTQTHVKFKATSITYTYIPIASVTQKVTLGTIVPGDCQSWMVSIENSGHLAVYVLLICFPSSSSLTSATFSLTPYAFTTTWPLLKCYHSLHYPLTFLSTFLSSLPPSVISHYRITFLTIFPHLPLPSHIP